MRIGWWGVMAGGVLGLGAWLSLRGAPATVPAAEIIGAAPGSSGPAVDPAAVRRAIAQRAPPAQTPRAAVGPADLEAVDLALAGLVQSCYARRWAAGGRPAGRLGLRFTLVKASGEGRVTELAAVDDTTGDGALVGCILGAARVPFAVPPGAGELVARLSYALPPPGAKEEAP